jgi:RNA polymerase-binding transcription factor DksA
MTPEELAEIEARFGADVRARREHDPAVRDVLALTAEVRRLQSYIDTQPYHSDVDDLVAERGRLRAAVDAVLVLHRQIGHDLRWDNSKSYGFCNHCGDSWPCRTARALAPVADPDPHTTSDEETPDA